MVSQTMEVGSLCRADAAKYLGISIRLLDKLRETGRLKPVYILKKPVYRVIDLRKLLEEDR
jgi:hypothetical protein